MDFADCEICRKTRATIRLTSIAGCRTKERHLCSECARTADLGVPVSLAPPRSPSADEPRKRSQDGRA